MNYVEKMMKMASDLIVCHSPQQAIIIDTKHNKSFNRNLPQVDKICFDFTVTLLSNHCYCGKNADRGIPSVHYLKSCQALNQHFEDKVNSQYKTETIKKKH